MPLISRFPAFLFFILLLLSACGKKEQAATAIPFTPYVIADSSKVIELPTGVKIYMVSEGPGPKPAQGSRVCIHFYGHLPNGQQFESSWEKGSLFCFLAGTGEVIPGLDQAIAQLNLGSKAVVDIPVDQTTVEKGTSPAGPGNSRLIFHIDVQGNF
jgi:FKBP-type peptidyl-prolyl cis-trans isomerase FkpA